MTKSRKPKGLVIALAVVLLLVGAVGLYAADCYHAGDTAAHAMASSAVTVTVEDGLAVFAPNDPAAGLIFYPGGKVEYTAYAPLMEHLASQGVLCVITEMPLQLAVLDMDAAAGIPERFPQVDTWYIGGHSLGGAMAASYAAEEGGFAGLLLLGAYSTADLTSSGLRVLSIYGANDGVLNREKYAECAVNLPDTAEELVIDGGNHAMFGDYGRQEGDGEGWISPSEQQTVTAEAVLCWMGLKAENLC